MKVRHRRVGREGGQGLGAAVGTEGIGADPALAQRAGVLGRALADSQLFGEAEIASNHFVDLKPLLALRRR